MPSLLGFYQAWINWFQTAKPIELIRRLIRNFNIYWKLPILDLYSGSWNVIKAIEQEWLDWYWFELGWINKKNLIILEKNLKDIEDIIFLK